MVAPSTLTVNLWLATAVVVLSIVIRYVLYPALFSPLAKIPSANASAHWSGFWILRKRFQEQENREIYKAHQKYGPIVRLGPNEVSVNDYHGGLRPIYGGNFEKHAWYANIFSNYRIPNTFCITGTKDHHERKRLFTNIYSKSYLHRSQDFHSLTKELIWTRLLPVIERGAMSGKPLDVLELGAAIGMDFTCGYLFGPTAGSDFIRDVETRRRWLEEYEGTKSSLPWVGELLVPVIVGSILGLNFPVPKQVLKTIDKMGDWNLKMCRAAQEQVSTRPLVYDHMRTNLEKVDVEKMSGHSRDMIIASEMLDHILAGHETSAVTITYIIYELSRPENADIVRSLYKELRASNIAPYASQSLPTDLPDLRNIDDLPYLEGIWKETLRRYPPASGSEPRVTPSGGTNILGYDLPGGVRISCSQYSLHRNAQVFPDPEVWKPQRWLEADKQKLQEMNQWFWAFGSGPRMCLGVHFATIELKLVLALIYLQYETSLTSDQDYEHDMYPKDGFVGRPQGNKCLIRFTRRSA